MPARVILLQFADAKISNWICVLPDRHDTDPDRPQEEQVQAVQLDGLRKDSLSE